MFGREQKLSGANILWGDKGHIPRTVSAPTSWNAEQAWNYWQSIDKTESALTRREPALTNANNLIAFIFYFFPPAIPL